MIDKLRTGVHKLVWGFEIQTDLQIPARKPDLVIIKKRKRKHAELWNLPQSNILKNMKWEISIKTLQENCKKYGTWK